LKQLVSKFYAHNLSSISGDISAKYRYSVLLQQSSHIFIVAQCIL